MGHFNVRVASKKHGEEKILHVEASEQHKAQTK